MMNYSNVSIVIPIHNEEVYLNEAIDELNDELYEIKLEDYEIILVENASADRTLELAHELEKKYDAVRVVTSDQANYGLALKAGMLAAEKKHILNFDLDYMDVDFLQKAVLMLEFEYSIIIGSKNALLSRDNRAFFRRFVSQVFRIVLFTWFGLKVSDTHGIKAWKNNEGLVQLVEKTVYTRHIFDTELIIRAQREGLHIFEIPVGITEKRPSSDKHILKRVPEAVMDLAKLWYRFGFVEPKKDA